MTTDKKCPDDVPQETWLAMRKWWDAFRADDLAKALFKLANETLHAEAIGRLAVLDSLQDWCKEKIKGYWAPGGSGEEDAMDNVVNEIDRRRAQIDRRLAQEDTT